MRQLESELHWFLTQTNQHNGDIAQIFRYNEAPGQTPIASVEVMDQHEVEEKHEYDQSNRTDQARRGHSDRHQILLIGLAHQLTRDCQSSDPKEVFHHHTNRWRHTKLQKDRLHIEPCESDGDRKETQDEDGPLENNSNLSVVLGSIVLASYKRRSSR